MDDSNFDPSTLGPSGTGREAITLADLFSNVPGGKGDQWGKYQRLMQYVTQQKRDAGAAARRAMAGMPAGPRDVSDDVQLQQPGAGQGLMALLFGGLK